jgi:hypothetical protein
VLRPSDVAVGLLTENTPRMLGQAIRLLRSIRWFGGEMARARVVVCGVGALESGARKALEALGAEVRVVCRFHPANRPRTVTSSSRSCSRHRSSSSFSTATRLSSAIRCPI